MISTYLKNQILKDTFRGEPYTPPKTMYLAVGKSSPSDDGNGLNEPTAPSYKRYAIASNTSNWTSPTTGTLSNANLMRFEEAQETWTTPETPLTNWALFDSQTGGNMLFFDSLSRKQEVPAGAVLEIPQNSLITTILND